ncbi:MAG: hypothetical protein LBP50_05715, partial [Tannerella sp.]|jgi:hypothetical protein|nr:hypothetical protein [Tannerella sp.]
MAWSLDHAIRQNADASGSVMRDRILTLALASLGSAPDFPREYAAMYWPAVGKREGAVINYFETWKEIFDANFRNADGSPNPPPAWEGAYGNEMHVLMILAKQAGLPGAASTLEWVDYEAGNGTMIGSLNARAAYALSDVLPASGTSVDPVPAVRSSTGRLKAASLSGGLRITGLVQGEHFRIYNLHGQLVCRGTATAAEARVPLPEHGVYIVTAGNEAVKAVY